MVPGDFEWDHVPLLTEQLTNFTDKFSKASKGFNSTTDVETFIRKNKKFFSAIAAKKSKAPDVTLGGLKIPGALLLFRNLFLASDAYHWLVANFGYIQAVRMIQKLVPLEDASVILSKATKFDDEVRTAFRTFLHALQEYTTAFSEKVDDAGPLLVGPPSLQFMNVDHMSSEQSEFVEENLKKVVSIFQRNGFHDILKVTKPPKSHFYYLLPREGFAAPNVAAFFMPNTKNFYIFVLPVTAVEFNLTFIHEFGHLVYTDYIGSKAKDYWFESWGAIQAEQDKRAPALQTKFKVTYQDRKYFFEVLKKAKFDLAAAADKVRKPLRQKYLAWLYDPSGDFARRDIALSYLQDAVEPTLYAEHEFLPFFKKGPEKYIQQRHPSHKDPEWLEERFMRALGLAGPNMKRPHPVVDWGRQTRQVSFERAKEQALEDLGLPTEYSKTDALEDFSETFAYYLLDPKKLSALAKTRMIKTLKIAGLYKGKVPFFAAAEEEGGYFTEETDSMDERIPQLAASLVMEGHEDEAIQIMEASLTKEAFGDDPALFRSIDSLVKRNDGLWKSEKQGKFLLDSINETRFQSHDATAWAQRQRIPFMKVAYYQSGMSGFGHRDPSKIRMRGMVYLFDQGGVVLRGKVKIIHPKGGEGNFDPDWSHVEINFRRPANVQPGILVGDPDLHLKQQIKKNKPTIDLIKSIPHWEEKDILDSFMYQLSKGYTLSPAQVSVVKRMTPDGFSLSDRQQWEENFTTLIDNIVKKMIPAKVKLYHDELEEKDQRTIEILRELENAERELKTRSYTTESWIGREIIYQLEDLVNYRAGSVSIYGDASEQLYKQHQKAIKAKKPSKKALKVETFIQKAADKLESMTAQQVYSWLHSY